MTKNSTSKGTTEKKDDLLKSPPELILPADATCATETANQQVLPQKEPNSNESYNIMHSLLESSTEEAIDHQKESVPEGYEDGIVMDYVQEASADEITTDSDMHRVKDPDSVALLSTDTFKIGDPWGSAKQLLVDANSFASDNCFSVSTFGRNQIRCSLWRQPQDSSTATRKRHSNTCGCPWKILHSTSSKTPVVRITKVIALHNHDMNDAMHAVSLRRSGQAVKLAIENASQVLMPYLSTTRKPTCDQFRDLLKPIVHDSVKLNSKAIGSIVRGVQAQVDRGLVPNVAHKIDKKTLAHLRSFSTADRSAECCRDVLDDVIGNTSNELSWIVSRLFAGIKQKDDKYFSNKYHYNSNGMIDAMIWQEGRGRAALESHGRVSFFDFRLCKGMNSIKYVYFAWIVVDENNQFIPASEGLMLAESDDLYLFGISATLEMSNIQPEFVKIVFGDDKVKESFIKKVLPESIVMLDYFHFFIGNRGISILSTDFGDAWLLVKEPFRFAILAKTEAECVVSDCVWTI